MPVTIRDVARAAGVSVTTVSHAFNGYEDVGEETKRRVLQVAKDLKYRPSRVARSLVLQQTQSVGLLISDFNANPGSNHFLFDVLAGIHNRLADLGYDVTLLSTTTARQQLISYIDFCTERRLEGVIVMGMRMDDPYMREVADASLVSVGIDLPILSEHCGYVMTDNVAGAKLAVNHLLSKNHQRIGLVNGRLDAVVSIDRLKGYEAALVEAGIGFDPELVVHADFLVEGGEKATAELVQRVPDLTAIFYASDLMALGGIRYLQKIGRMVPEDVAVVGFDNIDVGQWVLPALTTVAQQRYRMGAEAAEMLVSMLQRQREPSACILSPELIVRQSS
ncbi:LacI family DNA-binding transcriptional regulator [Sulfobacillus sp. hq2]|uniref:LacI family DNA-binding transcriptional regulator n=1 Tax=Sulfobacillus sp. hq2 TaxID=2039167 RepID=UPI000CD24393|nr:LacI family DNA-binding transcriptional regulator [Sulfobacillus sp. hq2]POB09605.1 LacI family transcriptional regulator [Sulfobacillus sp. hq2]